LKLAYTPIENTGFSVLNIRYAHTANAGQEHMNSLAIGYASRGENTAATSTAFEVKSMQDRSSLAPQSRSLDRPRFPGLRLCVSRSRWSEIPDKC
jgi:hypothetical protein